ncbi:transposase [Streptomyces inhibens]|uniref:transposase n=1 Tax=Streptomyces inhibens TaxID=2293571 RepID=UPI00378777DE
MYLRGLLTGGGRTSVELMAARLGEDGNRQALPHFITSSPWGPGPCASPARVEDATRHRAGRVDDRTPQVDAATRHRRPGSLRLGHFRRGIRAGHALPRVAGGTPDRACAGHEGQRHRHHHRRPRRPRRRADRRDSQADMEADLGRIRSPRPADLPLGPPGDQIALGGRLRALGVRPPQPDRSHRDRLLRLLRPRHFPAERPGQDG